MFRNAVCRVAPTVFKAASSTAAPRAPACSAAATRALSTALAAPPVPASSLENLGNQDGYFEKDRVPKGDPGKREFTYMMLGAGRFAYASAARLILLKFLASWNPASDVLALATAEFDLSDIEMGSTVTFKWRGKPVMVKRRTAEMIEAEAAVHPEDLRDQETDEERCLKSEFMVVIGICTHLGCVPIPDAGDFNGWFCPCHGSHYDTSGRARKGPAPLNLEIPPYKFIEKRTILIG